MRPAKPSPKKVAVIAAESDAFLEKGINLNNTGRETPRQGRPPKVTILHSGSYWALSLPSSSAASAWESIWSATSRVGLPSIVKPMQALGSGDLSAEVSRRGEKTEIGAMADALAGIQGCADRQEGGRRVAAGTPNTRSSAASRVDTLTQLRSDDRRIGGTRIVGLDRTRGLRRHADRDRGKRAGHRHHVAAASEDASTNVQSVASATEEITSSVNEISRQVQEEERVAGEAVVRPKRPTSGWGIVAGGRPDRRRHRTDHRGRRARPICLRSTPPSRRRAPVKPAAASRWSRRKSRLWPNRPRKQPARSVRRSQECRPPPGIQWRDPRNLRHHR